MNALQPVRPLRNEADYEAALAQVEAYFDNEPEPGTPDGDRFELLGLVISRYEQQHFPIGAADPVEVIRLVMDAKGFTQTDLAALLGSRPRASEILSGKRDLALGHIRKLHLRWGIPTDALVGATEPA